MAPRLACLLTFLFFVGAARADQRPAAPKDAATVEAGRRYEVGMRLYNVSEWAAALEEFKQAYLVKADPAFLFNIGQCQRQLGRWDDAAKSYRAFLREADDITEAKREQVRTLVAQMEQAVREARASQPPTETTPPKGGREKTDEVVVTPPSNANTIVASPPPAKKPLYKKWWLWTAVGVGAGALALGLGLGLGLSGTSFPSVPTDATVKF